MYYIYIYIRYTQYRYVFLHFSTFKTTIPKLKSCVPPRSGASLWDIVAEEKMLEGRRKEQQLAAIISLCVLY